MASQRYLPSDLLNAYNSIVTAKGLPAVRMSPTTYKAFDTFGSWCEQRGIDPDAWVTARHAAIGWRFVVPAKKLVSDKFVGRFKSYAEDRAFDDLAYERDRRRVVDATVPMEQDDTPTYLGEVMKKQLGGDRESCLVNLPFTGGWNPKSPFCVKCELTADCKAALDPAVLARRESYVGR